MGHTTLERSIGKIERVSREGDKQSLLMITLGPVQEFIAQARRTRDLWFGSTLLSELSYEVAKCLHDQGANMVFPHFRIGQKKVANKIVGLVSSGAERDLAIMARTAARDCWYAYAYTAKEKLGTAINEGSWERQIKDLLEFYAVWVELDVGQGYAQALSRAESLMAARKTLRDFRANEPGKLYGEPKSDLDPGRESVLWPEKHHIYGRFGISEKEALDAISLVKRLAHHVKPDSRTFLSVCDIAFAPLRQKLSCNEEWRTAANNYQQKAIQLIEQRTGRRLEHPAHGQAYHSWLFYGNRMEEYLLEKLAGIEADRIEGVLLLLQNEMEFFYKQTGLLTTPYYALVVCDGDHMHKRLQEISDPNGHQKLSERLAIFSDQAEEIFKDNQGVLIYSGGDDVMGLLPVTTCFDTIALLRTRFQELLNQEAAVTPVTLSVGMTIAHMFVPLEEVRQQATQAEKMAKEERDSLAIWFQKRSGGSQMRISIPFDSSPALWIQEFQKLFEKRILSHTFVYELRSLYQEYERLFHKHAWLDETEQLELLTNEMVRLAIKKRPNGWCKEEMKVQLAPLCDMLRKTAGSVKIKTSRNPLQSLKIVAEMGIIAAEILREGGGNVEHRN